MGVQSVACRSRGQGDQQGRVYRAGLAVQKARMSSTDGCTVHSLAFDRPGVRAGQERRQARRAGRAGSACEKRAKTLGSHLERPSGDPKAPQKLQVEPKSGQVGPQSSQEAPSWVQQAPKSGQVGPKRHPRAPKLAPRGAQDAPRGAQDAPRDAQDAATGAQDAPRGA